MIIFNLSCTSSATFLASPATSLALAVRDTAITSGCFSYRRAPPTDSPLTRKTLSNSHASDTFRPFSAGKLGKLGYFSSNSAAFCADTTGLRKNEPAVPSFFKSGNFPARTASTFSRTCVMFSFPQSTRSLYEAFGAPFLLSLNAARKIINRPGSFLNRLVRYPNMQSTLLMRVTASLCVSKASTHTRVSLTSLPYAPMFCTGAAPTGPGVPDKLSIPHHLAYRALHQRVPIFARRGNKHAVFLFNSAQFYFNNQPVKPRVAD